MGKRPDAPKTDAHQQSCLERLAAGLREHRLRQGLTLEELSVESGLSGTYYGMVERGDRRLALSALLRIMERLKVSRRDRIRFRLFLAASEITDEQIRRSLLAALDHDDPPPKTLPGSRSAARSMRPQDGGHRPTSTGSGVA